MVEVFLLYFLRLMFVCGGGGVGVEIWFWICISGWYVVGVGGM